VSDSFTAAVRTALNAGVRLADIHADHWAITYSVTSEEVRERFELEQWQIEQGKGQ
jgi:hypothetical protein